MTTFADKIVGSAYRKVVKVVVAASKKAPRQRIMFHDTIPATGVVNIPVRREPPAAELPFSPDCAPRGVTIHVPETSPPGDHPTHAGRDRGANRDRAPLPGRR